MYGLHTVFVSNDEPVMPLSARRVSTGTQFVSFDGDNWRTIRYEHRPLQQRFSFRPLMADEPGVYADVFQGPSDMRRFRDLGYAGPSFPILERSYVTSPDDYLYSRRTYWTYDGDGGRSWDFDKYHVPLDRRLDRDEPFYASTWPLFDDHHGYRRTTFSNFDDTRSIHPSTANLGQRSENGFRRLFDRRRHGRREDLRRDHEIEQRMKYIEVDLESLDSFENLADQNEMCGNEDSQPFDILKTYLRRLEKERAKMKRERLHFQRLNSGLQDLLRSWEGVGRTHEPAPHTAEGVCAANWYERSPQFDCPLSAATDPGPGFPYGDVPPTSHFTESGDAVTSIDRYNQAWTEAKDISASGSNSLAVVPWPTPTLKAEDLSRDEGVPFHLSFEHSPRSLPPEISNDLYHLRKWNAFNFYLKPFGLKPFLKLDVQHDDDVEGGTSFIFDIEPNGATREKLDKLKAQLIQEKLRWHPDRLKRMRLARFSELQNECAKAVWGAVVDASKALERCSTFISNV
ncbi:hypothetical protein VTO42DRAFT_8628 [Malbranchea cinnamomea]